MFSATKIACPACEGLSSPEHRAEILPGLLAQQSTRQRRKLRAKIKQYDRTIDKGQEEPCEECGGLGYIHQVTGPYPEEPREIEVPDRWRVGTKPDFHYDRRCYIMAARYMLRHPEIEGARLVHGAWRVGEQGNHAWVDLPGGVVFDANRQRFYDGASYYVVATAHARYTLHEAFRLMNATGHIGPWHSEIE